MPRLKEDELPERATTVTKFLHYYQEGHHPFNLGCTLNLGIYDLFPILLFDLSGKEE